MSNYSIKDVAKLADVSIATVSRVLNKKGKYSKETEEKVLKVVEEIGYQVNHNAKTLRTKVSHTIGILVPDISNYFFATLVQEIEKSFFENSYSTIICNTDRSLEKEKSYLQILENKNIDALIAISGNIDKGFEFSSTIKNIPYICIDREPANLEESTYISSDHFMGAYQACSHLLDKKCKQIAFFGPKKLSPSNKRRFDGFLKALEEKNIEFNEEKNRLQVFYNKDLEKQVVNFLKSNSNLDGIFAINDRLAIDLIQILKKNNKKIPEDISLVGFDNSPTCEYTSPKLTSISQNIKRIADETVENILESINNPEYKKKTILVPTQLIERESTK